MDLKVKQKSDFQEFRIFYYRFFMERKFDISFFKKKYCLCVISGK